MKLEKLKISKTIIVTIKKSVISEALIKNIFVIATLKYTYITI